MILEHVHNIILVGKKQDTTLQMLYDPDLVLKYKYMQNKKSERKRSEPDANSGCL